MKRIVHLSDTHNSHRMLLVPQGDIIIHSGDATNGGTEREVLDFLDWFGRLNFKHKIYVPGNHDICVEKNFNLISNICAERNIDLGIGSYKGLWVDEGKISFCMFPWVNPVGRWAFLKTEEEQERILNAFESYPCDILITHSPPHNILDSVPFFNIEKGCMDEHPLGSKAIFNYVVKAKSALHLFGHVHECGGRSRRFNNTLFVNSATRASVIDYDVRGKRADLVI